MTYRLVPLLVVGVLALAGCFSSDPPWTDAEGDIVSAGLVIEFRGFKRCNTESVMFFRFFGRQYGHDPEGALGTLHSPDGSGLVLTYEILETVPSGAVATGVTRGEREIYVDSSDVEDYLYVVHPNHVERWPRAEIYCE